MSAIPPDLILPSTVDECRAKCPQFRILVVGNSGVGKSSLISKIFNIEDIDIAHDRAGKADVEKQYIWDRNPFFILHDSQGFEAGGIGNWKTVDKFLRDRSTAEPKDRVHAIWLCIETPRTGARVKETGDEELLILAKELKIPLIIVFTKFDLFVNEYLQNAERSRFWKKKRLASSQAKAEGDFKKRIESSFLRGGRVPYVRVSNQENHIETLDRLVEDTYENLPEEEGQLLAWVTAQQVNARQKVEESIRQGCKKYWINLGQSVVFKDRRLIDCLVRISQDILGIWNFDDPNNLLSTDEFLKKIIALFHDYPLADNEHEPLQFLFAPPAGTRGTGLVEFLYRTYKAIPATAQFLGIYIIDLIAVLRRIFTVTLTMESPRKVSQIVIDEQLQGYKESSEFTQNHDGVRGISITAVGFERKIAGLIRKSLGSNAVRGGTSTGVDHL